MIHKDFLLADAEIPLISCDELRDELLIYNLDETATNQLFSQFEKITGKALNKMYKINELSGGQKVILMALLAIYSPARKIRFQNLTQSLYPKRRQAIEEIIQNSGKEIVMDTEDD
ncbi:MAG: hypothetical protein ABFC98_02595 [Candidatus Cloacimonas sp.]